jgi:hypothetical protein
MRPRAHPTPHPTTAALTFESQETPRMLGAPVPFRFRWQLALHFVAGSVREVDNSDLHVVCRRPPRTHSNARIALCETPRRFLLDSIARRRRRVRFCPKACWSAAAHAHAVCPIQWEQVDFEVASADADRAQRDEAKATLKPLWPPTLDYAQVLLPLPIDPR